ncbi:MAG: UvrD-helicase domain-containing protein, partial [Thermoanaerobaculia bacterium]
MSPKMEEGQALLPFGEAIEPAPEESRPDPRANLVIEAGAGTGKTTRIVGEVLRLLLGDATLAPERVVLITFTEKAAGEIGQRIREAVMTIAAGEGERIDWPATSSEPIVSIPPSDAARARDAARSHVKRLDKLRSQTIHSFCQGLLRLHPVEAGVDPQFQLVQGFERSRRYQEIYDQWVHSETATESPEPERYDQWTTVFRHFGQLDALRTSIFALLSRRDLLADGSYSIGGIEEADAEIRDALNELRRADPASCEELAEKCPAALAIIEYVRATAEPERPDLEAWIRTFDPVAKELSKVNVAKVGSLREPFTFLKRGNPFDTPRTIHQRLLRHRAALAFQQLALRFFSTLDREKNRLGIVDFDDLLIRTDHLLENPEILEAARSRYDFIFVDEFQDTDRIQARIVERLSRDTSGRLVPGRVILVGDPKQSIYGFRRADPETYGATVRSFEKEGAEIQALTGQYRSRRDLVEGFNALFGNLFPSERSLDPDVFRPAYADLDARSTRPARDDVPFVVLRAPGGEDESERIRAEAESIAAWIEEHRSESSSDLRRFAILLRRRKHMLEYADALERRGIATIMPPAQ